MTAFYQTFLDFRHVSRWSKNDALYLCILFFKFETLFEFLRVIYSGNRIIHHYNALYYISFGP